jgi:DNA (cytosine-5)-methyltransferase 1
VIVAGFPCQDLSVAGRRAGLDGARSGLFFEIVRLVEEMRQATDGRYPEFVVLENVPGLLSADAGRAFARVLSGLADTGALDIAWAVLDAQWFGVPQRRRRVFVVADFRGERAAEILSVPYSGDGDTPPRREAGARVAGGAKRRAYGVSENPRAECRLTDYSRQLTRGGGKPGQGYPTVLVDDVSLSLAAKGQRLDGPVETFVTHALTAEDRDASEDGTGRGTPLVTVRTSGHGGSNGLGVYAHGDAPTLDTCGNVGVAYPADPRPGLIVRRLTPTECERLMGLPDDWLDDLGLPDTTKYRMLGNGAVTTVVAWIGRRIVDTS